MKENITNYPVLLTAGQVAERLGVSYQTPLRWARQKTIPAIRLPGGQLRFRESDIDAIIDPEPADLSESDEQPHPDQLSLLDDDAVGEREAC